MSSGLAIRDFTPDDYPLLSAVDAAAYDDDARAVELWQHDDATRDPDLFLQRHVIELDGVPIACGTFGHSDWIDDPDKYWFQILMSRDRDLSQAREEYLRFALEALSVRRPYALYSGMVEDYGAHIQFLEANGFRPVHRERVSRLELARFDPEHHRNAVLQIADQGIRIVSLQELAGIDWKERLHPVYQELARDQPAPDPPRLETLDEWERTVLGAPNFDPELWIVALDGDEIIGLSQASVGPESPHIADCGLTGVSATHRRRGIGTALKVELLALVKQRGVARISTTNEEHNPMFLINERLGFVPRPDWVMYELTLRAP
jgi:GNAT superfamily N-acetyltransferase